MTLARPWLLVWALLLPCRAQCEPLTFAQAVELALNHNGYTGQTPPEAGQPASLPKQGSLGQSANQRFCPIHPENYSAIAAQFASANEMGVPPGTVAFSATPAEPSAGAFELRSRASVVLCTALVYAKLQGIRAQQHVLRQQQEYVHRLMDIESRRVSAEVDHPLLLAQAKLLRARTRMESDALAASERKTRAALSVLTGLSIDLIETVENSMPPLPDNPASTGENREILQQLMAYRDIVQLDYQSEYLSRIKATHDMALARASIGSLVFAHVTEEMKLIALLQLNNQVRMAKIQLLSAAENLEAWALRHPAPNANLPSAPPDIQASDSSAPSASSNFAAETPSLLSILIAPAIKDLPVGKSQQYSAIATWSNGRAKDVTSDARWNCSTDTGAVLSSTGLLTGLSVGAVTIRVEFQGVTHSRKLEIVEQPADEYLLPQH